MHRPEPGQALAQTWQGTDGPGWVWKGLGRGLEGLGLAQGWLGIRKWAKHAPNLRRVGANLGPTWDQLETTWSQLGLKLFQSCLQKTILSNLEAISRPLEGCEARDPKFYEKMMNFFQKLKKFYPQNIQNTLL